MPLDLLIIGGGIVGGSIAFQAARAGFSVSVCEAGRFGGEASWAGAGMLVPGSEYEVLDEACRFAIESLRLWPEFAAKLQEASGEPIDFRVCGSLELAEDETHWRELQRRAALQRAWGMRNEVVDVAALARMVPALRPGLAGAIYYPEEAQVDPRTVMAALRSAYRAMPVEVELREECRVERIEPGPSAVRVRLTTGEVLEAGAAVLAAGAWSSGIPIEARQQPAAIPVKGHLVGYELTAGTLPHVLRCHHTYVVQRNSGYTIAGATEEHAGFDRTLVAAMAEDVASRAAQLVPGLLHRAPAQAWNGFRPGTPDGLPCIGQFEDTRLWLAYGHFRNGILLAPATARRVVSAI